MIRTDLALETREMLNDSGEIDGVEITTEQDDAFNITVTWVAITNEHGARVMGKPVGNYVTVESAAMRVNDYLAHEEIMKVCARKLGQLKPLAKDAAVLVVGLGNRMVTPDALGPMVCEKILVTRHMGENTPKELEGKIRTISALAPGVMGVTGIETGEIIKGVVEKTKPDMIIAVDALAARQSGRINATVQLTDTGVVPGAGMGKRRMELNERTLGVPVLAIGVPTVVDAATLVNDMLDNAAEKIKASPEGEAFYKMLAELGERDKYAMIKELLSENMFVTPKDIDAVMGWLANIVANALNMALHPGIGAEDVNRFMA